VHKTVGFLNIRIDHVMSFYNVVTNRYIGRKTLRLSSPSLCILLLCMNIENPRGFVRFNRIQMNFCPSIRRLTAFTGDRIIFFRSSIGTTNKPTGRRIRL